MKKALSITSSILIIMAAACGMDKAAVPEKDQFIIVTSFYPVYVIAINVAGGIDGVEVVNMTPPVTGCLHDYSITAGDMKNLENADIFLANGAGMETFMDTIARKYPDLKIAELSEGIRLLGDGKEKNPHVWVSISNEIRMIENCAGALSVADGRNAAKYRVNADRYIGSLDRLKKEMHLRLDKFRGKKIITFHEAFPYFADEFGLEITAVVERDPGSQPSAKELADTIKIVRKSGIKALFAEPQYPSSSADTISKETGAAVFILDPAVTGDDNRDAYINIMKKNMSIIEQALK
ncbi:MAG: metal ABC transporter substrate-binding protein [Spirochaetes bacterium]|jgi:zinc transport system substrate-binding protein|nr:metal ABC transporter substrate-binding protein [Spirochaetota bacterium]